MEIMRSSCIKRLVLKKEGFEIELERESLSDAYKEVLSPLPSLGQVPTEQKPTPAAKEAKEERELLQEIVSPMVGTFYEAPSPDDPPFLKVGDTVDEEMIVCIIEAMKVMNEIKAGIKGMVVELLVKNGDPVEFGTTIFRVKPT